VLRHAGPKSSRRRRVYLADVREGTWRGKRVRFCPGVDAPEAATFVIGFIYEQDRFLVADIRGRGWCVPSGRVEPGEPAVDAMRRELWEETGATAGDLTEIGHYEIGERADRAYTVAFVGALLEQGALPAGSESRATALMSIDELRTHYFEWSPLFEDVFVYALSRRL
jgi:8-oxo-dGTP diphosphatase